MNLQVNRMKKEEYKIMREHLNILNHDPEHFESSNDICTPMECVEEMVNSVPKSLWKRPNLKVLDSCCGNGNFHAFIQTKTDIKNLYFNEINRKRINNLIDQFGKEINLTDHDFLDFPDEEKYDMVVSNPPYAKINNGKRASKNHNLSRAFIEKAIRITKKRGYILFIAPDNWMSFSDRNILPEIMSQYQFLHLNIHGAKKYFPKVGSSFTWFLMQKVPNKKPFKVQNHYKIKDTVEVKLDEGIQFIPLYYSESVRSLINKTINSNHPKYEVETTSDLHRTTKRELLSPTKNSKHPYRLIHTPKQTVWSSRPHKYQQGWKVFISLSDKYGTFVDDCGMTQSVAFIRCKTKREAIRIKNELDNPVYRCINNLTRYGNFNNVRVLQRLPHLENISLNTKEKLLVEQFLGNAHYG